MNVYVLNNNMCIPTFTEMCIEYLALLERFLLGVTTNIETKQWKWQLNLASYDQRNLMHAKLMFFSVLRDIVGKPFTLKQVIDVQMYSHSMCIVTNTWFSLKRGNAVQRCKTS